MSWRWPSSLFGRLLLLMTTGLLVAQLAGALIQTWERQRTLGHTVSHELAQRIVAVYRVVQAQPTAQDREHTAQLLSIPSLSLDVRTQAPEGTAQSSMLVDLPGHIRTLLGLPMDIRATQLPQLGQFALDINLPLPNGQWLNVRGGAPEGVFALPWHLLLNLGLMLVAVVFLVAMAARSTVRPLTELARAAHNLSHDLRSPPVPEVGPQEVKEAAMAFNAMQARIRQGIEERERFLAAVSHDLKTPLTRLRLRTEMMADAPLRNQFQADTDDMLQLLDGTLDFLRGKAVDEPLQQVDLVALAESLVDDLAVLGPITLDAPAALQWPCRPRALKRALTNLVDNALKYGHSAHVELRQQGPWAEVLVRDTGPGLPEAEWVRVFEPFYRVESSRSRDTGGTGLGLAIVRQIALSHGGDVALTNAAQGGLVVRLRLGQPESSAQEGRLP